MTVENWLRAAIENIPVEENILEWALSTSVDAGFRLVSLSEDFYEVQADEESYRSLRYALSTLYYFASGQNGGSSRTEKVGDVSVSVAAWTLDWSKRNLWIRKADTIRKDLGFEPEEQTSGESGMFDANDPSLGLRNCYPQYFKPTRRWN